LCQLWLIQDDFLLADLQPVFTHIAGNPPYLRQELVPEVLIREYRKSYTTIFDRADLYIPFFEKSLHLLVKGGRLSFICSDRWMKNRYGGPLRQLISNKFHVESYIDMMGTGAFKTDVSAYPAITTIVNDSGSTTRVAKQPKVQREHLKLLADALSDPMKPGNGLSIEVIPKAIKSSAPWLLDCAKQCHLIRKLEDTFPLLEQVGCKVGIGVATGSDQVYIGSYQALDVEPDRKLPLIMAPDIRTGRIEWSGKGIINPFDKDGNFVALSSYPRLMRYLRLHEPRIRARNVAKRNPNSWYRTIDKISESLTYQPKLLIPDIKNEPNAVLDQGDYYPHHNLYWITSKEWDLRALQTVLRSSIAKLFVAAYSVKMRGGYLRYQAQNLRRICLPQWASVPTPMRTLLVELARSDDTLEVNQAIFRLYSLDLPEQEMIDNLTR
jgi:hypothetical protein